jgi:hypothetical protein
MSMQVEWLQELDESHTDLLRRLSFQWVYSGWKEWKENILTSLESPRVVLLLVTDGLGGYMKSWGSVPPEVTAGQSESKKFNEFHTSFKRFDGGLERLARSRRIWQSALFSVARGHTAVFSRRSASNEVEEVVLNSRISNGEHDVVGNSKLEDSRTGWFGGSRERCSKDLQERRKGGYTRWSAHIKMMCST